MSGEQVADRPDGEIHGMEISPLRANKDMLQDLEKLVPKFMLFLSDVKSFKEALGNGEIIWKPKFTAVE